MRGYQLPQRHLVSQQDAAFIEQARVHRSKFINRWTRKTAFDAGVLVPFLLDECLPGDHMSYDITAFVRMSTPIFPQFDGLRVDTFFFYVPMRLVWTHLKEFFGEQATPGASIAYTIPKVDPLPAASISVGSLYDHFGIPAEGQIVAPNFIGVNALPLRCYNLIYNTWFRDENLVNAAPQNNGDGPDGAGDYVLRKRNKAHDYFTSALPWPQKFTAPTVPLGGLAPILGLGTLNTTPNAAATPVVETNGTTPTYAGSVIAAAGVNNIAVKMSGAAPGAIPQVYADLAATSGVAINVLRQAWLVQQLLERDARGGTRYNELILSHFDIRVPDYRLQRPEYIGGGQSPLNITPIAQTSESASTPLGALGGAGTAAGTHRATYASVEHGYIIGIVSIRAELSYQQGLHKLWTRATRYDFYWPALAGLGEQAILEYEIYCTGTATDGNVFGYQERWQEYRTRYSDITGIMRSSAASNIDEWHLAEYFATPPALNETFISEQPPMARILAAGAAANNQQFLCDIQYERVAVRPIPTYGTPVTLGRF